MNRSGGAMSVVRGCRGDGISLVVSVGIEDVETFLHGYALVPVGGVLVAVDHTEYGVHRRTGGGFQRLAIQEVADEYGREDVARAVEESRYLVVLQMEVLPVVVVIGGYGILPVDLAAGDKSRLAANLAQFVEQRLGFFPADALHVDRRTRQIAGLGVVGEGEMSHADHLTHELHLALGHAVIKAPAVAEDGVYEDRCALGTLFLAIACHKFGLLVAEHQACADGIERETQLLPYGQRATDIVGRILDVELAIVERVGYESRWQAVSGNAQIGQDGEHGTHAHLAIAYNVVYQ